LTKGKERIGRTNREGKRSQSKERRVKTQAKKIKPEREGDHWGIPLHAKTVQLNYLERKLPGKKEKNETASLKPD